MRSFLEGPPDPRARAVFYPVIAVLTDDFLVSRSTELELLRFDLPTQERTIAPAYRMSLGVDPEHSRERYLVVFTPAQLVAGGSCRRPATPETAAEAARVAYLGAAPTAGSASASGAASRFRRPRPTRTDQVCAARARP